MWKLSSESDQIRWNLLLGNTELKRNKQMMQNIPLLLLIISVHNPKDVLRYGNRTPIEEL